MSKKLFSIILAVAMVFSICIPAYAADTSNTKQIALEIPVTEIPSDVLTNHQNVVSGRTRSAITSTYDEYEILSMMKAKTTEDLIFEGYSKDVVEDIKSGNVEERILTVTFERAALSEEELAKMGYSADEIFVMKNLSGDETLEQLSTYGILADCTCYNYLVEHYYKTSTGKTYFLVSYGWEWDKCPAWVLTDCAGVGWNHDFHPDETLDTSSKNYNTTYKTYVNQSDASDKKYSSKAMVEKELNTAEDQFDMNGFYGSAYYVKSGSGTMALSQTGRQNDAKFSFKYGHNEILAAPSVGYPWGVSFSLEGAESIFMPPEIVYSDFASTKN